MFEILEQNTFDRRIMDRWMTLALLFIIFEMVRILRYECDVFDLTGKC